MLFVTKSSRVAPLLAVLLTVGCGGPLSHTIKLSQVPEAKRNEVTESQLAAREAEVKRDEADHQIDVKKKALKKAEDAAKERGHDVEIAKAEVGTEKAKENADRDGDAKSAKTKLELAKVQRDVAEAQVDLSEEELDLARAQADQAKKSWLVALAEYESEKAARVTSTDPKVTEKKTKVTEQLEDKRADLKHADEVVKKHEKQVDKAKGRVADAGD